MLNNVTKALIKFKGTHGVIFDVKLPKSMTGVQIFWIVGNNLRLSI